MREHEAVLSPPDIISGTIIAKESNIKTRDRDDLWLRFIICLGLAIGACRIALALCPEFCGKDLYLKASIIFIVGLVIIICKFQNKKNLSPVMEELTRIGVK